MNSPTPVVRSTSAADLAATTAPTVGSLVGSLLGTLAATKLGLNPADANVGSGLVGLVAMLVTAAFHWIGAKLKTPILG